MLTRKQARRIETHEHKKAIQSEIDGAIRRTTQALRGIDVKDPDNHVIVNALIRTLEYLCSIKLRCREMDKRYDDAVKSVRKYKGMVRSEGKKPWNMGMALYDI